MPPDVIETALSLAHFRELSNRVISHEIMEVTKLSAATPDEKIID